MDRFNAIYLHSASDLFQNALFGRKFPQYVYRGHKIKKKCTIRVDRKDNICMVVLTPSDYVMCAIWR